MVLKFRALSSRSCPSRLRLPYEFDETHPATPEKSRADGCLHVLGIVTPANANPALDARCWAVAETARRLAWNCDVNNLSLLL